MTDVRPKIFILGTRGVPAAHGGFETFAERLGLFLVSRGWEVAIYCQRDVKKVERRLSEDRWSGIERINVEIGTNGPKATLFFDWICVRDAATKSGICLVLGYNGAAFLPLLRLYGRKIITNMDGLEWRRPKWSLPVRRWFYVNEWIAAKTSHRLVADHPEIAKHLATRRTQDAIAMIPYGADPVTTAPEAPVQALGLSPDRYLLSVSRIEPDNNILVLVEAFSRVRRGVPLVVVGFVDQQTHYGRAVLAAASDEVVFPGPIYDNPQVQALRFHARAYLHGHTVGGTNPSLVEALWAGNAVIAHDNAFNRWTADGAGLFFRDVDECADRIETVIDRPELLARLRSSARAQAAKRFNSADVFSAYEQEFLQLAAHAPSGKGASAVAATRRDAA